MLIVEIKVDKCRQTLFSRRQEFSPRELGKKIYWIRNGRTHRVCEFVYNRYQEVKNPAEMLEVQSLIDEYRRNRKKLAIMILIYGGKLAIIADNISEAEMAPFLREMEDEFKSGCQTAISRRG